MDIHEIGCWGAGDFHETFLSHFSYRYVRTDVADALYDSLCAFLRASPPYVVLPLALRGMKGFFRRY